MLRWVLKSYICEKDYIWNHITCSCKNGKYLTNIIDDSAIAYHEIIETTKTLNFNERKLACKTKKIDFLLVFLSNTVALLIVISIYSYLIKYRTKQKHLFPYNATHEKLK